MAEETVVTATPTATPAPTSAAAVLTPAPTPPTTVSVPIDQFQLFVNAQGRIAQLEAENRSRETAANEERIRILAEKGEAVKAVQTLREIKDAELLAEKNARTVTTDRAKRYALDGELARVLSGQKLLPHMAGHLTELWRAKFQVSEEGDSFKVHTPTFQSVEQFVAEQLARPEYAAFIPAKNPAGGTAGSTGGHEAAPTGDAPAPQEFKNYGEFLMAQTVAAQKAGGQDAARNLTLPFGTQARTA